MQADPRYDDVVAEVAAFLEERLAFAVEAGVREERVCLDPGIGFGKTVEHNFELVRRLDELTALGRPVVVGFSRKSSLGKLLGDPDATTGSTAASVGAAVAAYERGATILRVHDVREHVEALTAAAAALAMTVVVEVAGLEVPGRHGVEEEERAREQPFVYDVELELAEPAADRIEETVDYREVAASCARSRTAASSACSRRSPRRSPTRCSSASRPSASACGCASRRCDWPCRSSTRPLRSSGRGPDRVAEPRRPAVARKTSR